MRSCAFILRIPRDARVRAYRTRDTYDGVVPATSKRQPYCHSSYIELSGPPAHSLFLFMLHNWQIMHITPVRMVVCRLMV